MLDKTFNHQKAEKFWYSIWENSGLFKADVKSKKTPYTIMMPPPNVTGNLHIGHALTFTLQDILIRYYRRLNFDALWQPGMDHAGIATQMVVERQLSEKKIYRKDIGRDSFINKVWEWKEESGGMITSQLRALGSTPDWSRERFTMDEGLSEVVKNVFVHLYREGLIYRDKRLVNWDPKLLTAISDLEVENIETKSNIWFIKYPIKNYDNKFIVVATTRPETMLGDTGVAVHPEDKRYIKLKGEKVILPIIGREIPIIFDKYSDQDKGSGAVKITPAHDFNDFEVGRRHNLEVINIFDENASIIGVDEKLPYNGMDRFEARKKIISDLSDLGLIDKVEEITNTLPYGDRSGIVIEPWLMDQWYVDAKVLAKPVIEAVKTKKMRFVPENWENTFFDWMENIQPWCVSRQLWWGHRIPVWYGPDGKVFVEHSEQDAILSSSEYYGKKVKIYQDEDVLDTWFSSALWPFSTLGWPEKTKELEKYYPGNVLVTGFDIIFFWVARMMMMGMHFMKGEVPFKDIYIHALVRDDKGQKMSKSKGNVMDPLDISDKYGADSLRFTLAAMAAQGRDIKLSESRIAGYRNFSTKLWNASRFLEMNNCLSSKKYNPLKVKNSINLWIIIELNKTIQKVNNGIKNYKFNEAADSIYKFIWNNYCDWYLELIKPAIQDKVANKETQEIKETANWVLNQANNLLNPFMPFITETLNRDIFNQPEMQLTASWPEITELLNAEKANDEILFLIKLLKEIRSIKSELNISDKLKSKLLIKRPSEEYIQYIEKNLEVLIRVGKLGSCEIINSEFPLGSARGIIDNVSIAIPLSNLEDMDNELNRLNKELKKIDNDIERLELKLKNKNFLDKAPENVVEDIRIRRQSFNNKKESIIESISRLKN